MIKAESKGERTLRSASPHRNAYKSDFHAIKCSFDGTKSDSEAKSYANGASAPREDSRGRPFGNRINKIKNIFLQMDGQQPQEGQDASPVSPVSPVSKFAVNANKSNSANSQEPQNTDRTPKAEEVEIDKVALAEKFSVTRKLFERGMNDQPVTERPIPGRASTRLSHGKVPDEGVRGSRRSFGSSENINTNSAIKTPPISPVRNVPEDKSIDESKRVNRLSLNAGPISRRLENFIADGDNKESTPVMPEKSSSFQKPSSPGTDSTQQPKSPNADSSPKSLSPKSDQPTSPFKSISPVSCKLSSSSSTGELISPSTNHSPFKHSPSSSFGDLVKPSAANESAKGPSSPYKSSRNPEEPKSENHTSSSSSREQCLDSAGAGVVRAELVVVQNESSESEDDEGLLEDVMTKVKLQRELKSEAPIKDVNHTGDKFLEENVCSLDETKKREWNREEEAEEMVQRRRSSCHEDEDDDDDDDNEDEESEQEDQDECGKTSPVFYSFENAAFVDDKEAQAVGDKQEDEAEDEEHGEEYDEVPGLSEDEERPSRRTIRFSTEPIRVSDGPFFLILTCL